jgi:uncharacterized phage-like protein YoqJ
MKTNPLATAEFLELQREIYLEKLAECKTIEEGIIALFEAHLEACEIALASDESAPAPKPVKSSKSAELEKEYLLGFDGLDAEQYAFIYGATEAIENAIDSERSDVPQSDEYLVFERYQEFIHWNSPIECEFRWAMLEYQTAIEKSSLVNDYKFSFENLETLVREGLLTQKQAREIKNAVKAFYEDRARREAARKAIVALPHPDAVPANERIRRFNLSKDLRKKLAKHNISLDARLRSSSDQRDQLPYLIALFDSIWAYDVYLSQSLERWPAKAAFTVESQEDEQIAHMLACRHARALETFTDNKFNRFLAKRGRKPLPPRASRKSAPAPAPVPAPAPKAQITVAVTGHRPNKLWGYDYSHPAWLSLKEVLKKKLTECGATVAISGMALGVDTVFALAALELQIPVVAAIPCRDQERLWPEQSKRLYREILANPLVKTHLVTDAPYSAELMQKRNEWMVDHCDLLVAVWDGSPGGTANCVAYAKKIGRKIDHIQPATVAPAPAPKPKAQKPNQLRLF